MNNRTWAPVVGKAALILLPLLIAGLIAWGRLSSEQAQLRRELDQKASERTVQVQYESILRELQTISRRLEVLEARR